MKQVLEIEGNRYEITHFEIELTQSIDENGYPTAAKEGGGDYSNYKFPVMWDNMLTTIHLITF